MDTIIKKLIAGSLDEADTLMDGLESGLLDVTAWHNEQAATLGQYHTAAFLLGRNTDTLTDTARAYLLDQMTEQIGYLNRFAADLDAGMTPEMARARAMLYTGALKATYSKAQTWDWPLPYYPTVGTECMVNDGCSWRGEIIDTENLDGDWYWVMGAKEHCPTCLTRAARNPHRIRGGRLQ